jgi:hypothetical protein
MWGETRFSCNLQLVLVLVLVPCHSLFLLCYLPGYFIQTTLFNTLQCLLHLLLFRLQSPFCITLLQASLLPHLVSIRSLNYNLELL